MGGNRRLLLALFAAALANAVVPSRGVAQQRPADASRVKAKPAAAVQTAKPAAAVQAAKPATADQAAKPAATAKPASAKPAIAQPSTAQPSTAPAAPQATTPAQPAPAVEAKGMREPAPATSTRAAAAREAPTPASGEPAATTTVAATSPNLLGDAPHSPSTFGNSYGAPANRRLTSGYLGSTGLLRTSGANLGPNGIVRLALFGEYFRSSSFPMVGARDTRTAGTLSLDATFLRHFEAFLSYAASSNTNSEASPELMQSQGDLGLGVKGALYLGKGLSVGADLRLELMPGVGGQASSGDAFDFTPRAIVTFDASQVSKLPLLVHLNAGAIVDGSSSLLAGYELKPWEEFALGIHKYHRVLASVGAELPLPTVTPFVEWSLEYPLSSQPLASPAGNGLTVSTFSAAPQRLALGLKVTAIRDLTAVLGAELGLARYVASGVPATQPFNVVLGVGYAFDPFAVTTPRVVEVERTKLVEKTVSVTQPVPAATGKVAGSVFDAATKKPLPGVIVAMAGSGLPPVASDADAGRFLTHDLPPGKAQLFLSHSGYKTAAVEAEVEVGKVASVQAFLAPELKGAAVKLTLVSGKQKLAGRVAFRGPVTTEANATAEAPAATELPKGKYFATAEAEGYLSKVTELEIPESGNIQVEVNLVPSPKKVLVVVKDDHIQIKQQVHFATGKAIILEDSFELLDQVLDAIIRSGVKKLRIEGHTDNKGVKIANLKLSASRAEAVAEYLVRKGLERERVVAEGFGDTRPVAPNLTARGRELNRRVEFVIAER